MTDRLYSTDEVIAELGVSRQTLDHYRKALGSMVPVQREWGKPAWYSRAQVDALVAHQNTIRGNNDD